jgi:LysR family hca operon transcriptional activator
MQTTELTIHSASSPELTQALLTGKIDVAFLRLDDAAHGLEFKIVTNEPLFALLPADHRLASRRSIRLNDLAGKPFISFPKAYAPALRRVIDDHLARSGIDLAPTHEAETLPMVISLVLSTGGVSFLPAYAQRLLPPSVVARKLHGRAPHDRACRRPQQVQYLSAPATCPGESRQLHSTRTGSVAPGRRHQRRCSATRVRDQRTIR